MVRVSVSAGLCRLVSIPNALTCSPLHTPRVIDFVAAFLCTKAIEPVTKMDKRKRNLMVVAVVKMVRVEEFTVKGIF